MVMFLEYLQLPKENIKYGWISCNVRSNTNTNNTNTNSKTNWFVTLGARGEMTN